MNTTLKQLKPILFLISLSKESTKSLKDKGIDYKSFIDTISGYPHVEVHEDISEKLISTANHYNVVIIVGHQENESLILSDGSALPLIRVANAFPATFSGLCHVAVCGSSIIKEQIKQSSPNSKVRTSKKTTQLELQLNVLRHLLKRSDLSKDNYSTLYNKIRDLYKNAQRKKKGLEKLPSATLLGNETQKDPQNSEDSLPQKPSIFIPKSVDYENTFPIRLVIHRLSEQRVIMDIVYDKDPITKYRNEKENITINVKDEDDVYASLFFESAYITEREGQFKKKIEIKDGYGEVIFYIKVSPEFRGHYFLVFIKLLKEEEKREKEIYKDCFSIGLLQCSLNPGSARFIANENNKGWQTEKQTIIVPRGAGKVAEPLFKSNEEKEKWKNVFKEYVDSVIKPEAQLLEPIKSNQIAKIFISFFDKWLSMELLNVDRIKNVNGHACSKFLIDDCKIEIKPKNNHIKRYGDWFRRVISDEAREKNEFEKKINDWLSSRNLT